jgi:hypothetical protein
LQRSAENATPGRAGARRPLVDDYFVRENKSCGAVFKPDEIHYPIEIAHLAQDSRPFIEAGMAFTVANRLE